MGIPAASLALFSVLSPQEPAAAEAPRKAPPLAVLVGRAGELSPAALRLGDGGVVEGAWRVDDRGAPGEVRTRGGVLVRAARAGVKLDFPSGAEALFAPDGVLHLRTGEAAGPFAGGVELVFAGGDRLQIRWSAGSRSPLREVILVQGERALRIWRRDRADRDPVRAREFRGASFLVCGEGDAFYRPVVLGPLTLLERGLCSAAAAAKLPPLRIAVAAGPLAASLRDLPTHFPQPTTEFPGIDRLAAELAILANSTFGRVGRDLQPVVHGSLHFDLSRRFQLSIDPEGSGPLRLGLHVGDSEEPLVEWSVGTYTELHVLNPARGEEGASRYYRRGIRLADPEVRAGTGDLAAARELLQSLVATDRSR